MPDTIEKLRDLALDMLECDRDRDAAFKYYANMRHLKWDLPRDLEKVQWIRKVVTLEPHNAIEAATPSPHGTAFCVSIEARHGTTTGISATDRATTVRAAIDPATKPADLIRPGHTFPLRARDGGVLRRAGHTQASIDLARMAGLYPAAVICEVMDTDGSMARLPLLAEFAAANDLKLLTVRDLIAYRMSHERLVERIASPDLPTRYGEFRVFAYRSTVSGEEHIALVMGKVTGEEPVLVRVHSQCLTGDVFGSARCDCGSPSNFPIPRRNCASTAIPVACITTKVRSRSVQYC